MLHDEQRNKRRNNNKIILRVHKLTVKLKKTVTLINSDRLFFFVFDEKYISSLV